MLQTVPLNHSSTCSVEPSGIEPLPLDFQSSVRTSYTRAPRRQVIELQISFWPICSSAKTFFKEIHQGLTAVTDVSFYFVGMTGLEPAISWSQTTHTTNCTTSRLVSKNLYNIIETFSKNSKLFQKKIRYSKNLCCSPNTEPQSCFYVLLFQFDIWRILISTMMGKKIYA